MNTITGLNISDRKQLIPEETTKRWEIVLNIAARIMNVPAALVMQVHQKEIEVFLKSNNQENPYEKHEKAPLAENLYCETVMKTNAELHVPNALEDPEWCENPDIKINMISYLGLPLHWPSGEMFGTVCVLDNKTNDFSEEFKELLSQFRDSMESDLKLHKTISDLKNANKELKELRGLIPICANCKNVRDDQGYWNQIETYLMQHSAAQFSHSICPECTSKLYPELDSEK